MRRLRRLTAFGGLVAILAVLLTGCIHEDRSVTLQSDGSGTYVQTIGFQSNLLTGTNAVTVQNLNDYGETLKKAGGSYRSYVADGYTYWEYTHPFKTVAQLNQEMLQQPSADGATNPITPGSVSTTPAPVSGDTFSVSEGANPFAVSYHVTGHMSLVYPADVMSNAAMADLLADARESFSVTMPGWVTSHDGGTQSGNTVTYTIHVNEQATIEVVGGGLTPAAFLLGGAVLLIASLLAVFVFVTLLRGRRSMPEGVTVSAISQTVPYSTAPYPNGQSYDPPYYGDVGGPFETRPPERPFGSEAPTQPRTDRPLE